MNVLIISPEPWTGHSVSKHHYAQALAARGHQVAYLDPPDAGLTGLTIEASEAGKAVWIVRGPRLAPGLRFIPFALRRLLEARWLAAVEENLGWRFDIVWLFENSRFYDMGFAGKRVCIYHQVDLNQDFHIAQALATSHLRLTNTSAMLRRFSMLGFDGHKIDHGVAQVPADDVTIRDPRLRPGRIAAAYVGNLDIPYLDAPLISDLIAMTPQVDFHMIGTASQGNRLRSLTHGAENVFWWGRINSADIVPTLRSMDVLLLAYDSENYREQLANPHKLMEYMASGVVTVASFTEEYAGRRHLLAMADTRDEYVRLFRAVVGERHAWNAQEQRAARITFARDNTYDRQIDRISNLLRVIPCAIASQAGSLL